MMFQQPANEAPSLDDYLQAVATRKWLVALATVLGLLAAFGYQAYRTETYEAVARVVVGPSRSLSLNTSVSVAANLEREREIMLSTGVFEATAIALDVPVVEVYDRVHDVTVEFVPKSDVLTVSATDEDGRAAADLVNTISAAYVQQTEQEEIDFFEIRIGEYDDQISTAEADLVAIDEELARLLSERTTAVGLAADDPTRATQIAAIDAERSVNQTDKQQLIIAIRQAGVKRSDLQAAYSTRASRAELFSPAREPRSAIGFSNKFLNLLGLILGAGFGVAGAFLLARLDSKARGQEDIELALGKRVLSSVPNFGVGFADKRGEGALIMASESPSPKSLRAIEAFRRLRTGVSFLSPSDEAQAFLLSSAYPGEGKSTVSANLALAFAQSGKRVALVSADLRRPSLERLFGIEVETGLSEWLGGDDDQELLIELPQENLYMVPAGRPARNSSELLGSDRFATLIKELKSNFDIVLVDTPPILATADAGAASKHVDGVIVVVNSRKTETDQLLKVRSDLERAGSNLIGAVLNREQQKRALPWRTRDRYTYAYV